MDGAEMQPRRDVDASVVGAASAAPPGEKLTVVVRAASQTEPDLLLACDKEWTVRDLKTKLSQAHSLAPAESEQKLIYGGAVLGDAEKLSQVLRHPVGEGGGHVLHLVVAEAGVGAAEGVRHRAATTEPPPPTAPTDAQQLYAQYLQYYMASVAQQPPEQQQQWLTALLAGNYQLAQDQADVEPAPPALPAPAPEEDVPRPDWLDTALYVTMRLCFVYILVSHSASFTRLAIIFLVGVAVYLYETGVIAPRAPAPRLPAPVLPPALAVDDGAEQLIHLMDNNNPPNDDNNNIAEPNNNVAQANNIVAANAEAENIGAEDANPDGAVIAAPIEPGRDIRSIFSLSCTFVVALFTSLIPEQHDIV